MTAELGSTNSSALCALNGRTHGMLGSAGRISQAGAPVNPTEGCPTPRSDQPPQVAHRRNSKVSPAHTAWPRHRLAGQEGSCALGTGKGCKLLVPDTGICSSLYPGAGIKPSCWGEPSGTRAVPQPADFSSLPHEIKRLS